MAKILHCVDDSLYTQYVYLPSEPFLMLRDRVAYMKKQRVWCKTQINGFESLTYHSD